MTLPVDYSIAFTDLGASPKRTIVELKDEALGLIAERLKAEGARAFSGEVSLTRRGRDVLARGVVRAVLLRTCTVTLDLLEEEIEETIDLRLKPELTEADETSAEDVDLLAPPYLIGAGSTGEAVRDRDGKAGRIDALEILIQQAALAMDPFPRSVAAGPPEEPQDAGIKSAAEGATPAEPTHRPFAGLGAMMGLPDDAERRED